MPARVSVPCIRCHNIIPSELCNSRRHRQCPASREEVSRGQEPAKTACRAADYTIRIMLRKLPRQGAKVSPSNSRVRRRRTSSPPQGPPRNQSVGGLRTLRILRISVSARIRGRKVQPRAPSVQLDRPELAGSLSAVREVRRLNRFARGRPAAKGRVPEQVRHTAFVTVPPRYGSAVVQPGRYSSTPLPG